MLLQGILIWGHLLINFVGVVRFLFNLILRKPNDEIVFEALIVLFASGPSLYTLFMFSPDVFMSKAKSVSAMVSVAQSRAIFVPYLPSPPTSTLPAGDDNCQPRV